MQRWLLLMILALSLPVMFAGSSAAEATITKPKFMGVFKGSYKNSYPKAIVVKRFLITNGAHTIKIRPVGDEDTVQKMSERILNDFIAKGSESCKSRFYVIEEVATELDYHPDGSLLLHSDANVVCFNTEKPRKK